MKTLCFALFSVCLTCLAGCGLDGPIPHGPRREEAAASPAQPGATDEPAADQQKPDNNTAGAANAGGATENPRPRTENPRPRSGRRSRTTREKAAAGAGENSRGIGNNPLTAPITVPIRTYWIGREQINFLQIENNLKFYRAAHDGLPPKTMDEFMDECVKKSNIKLPQLPEGHTYVYDEKTGELMVQKPAP